MGPKMIADLRVCVTMHSVATCRAEGVLEAVFV
jgi:hypothetical protein